MLKFIIAGLVTGGIYAITSTGLVLTYQASGVFNFAFAAIAYTVARFYYFLNSTHHWPIVPAAIVAILVLGPALGIVLYSSIFRFLRLSPPVVKVMATIGVSVALPAIDVVIFGTAPILTSPGLAPQPVKVFHVFGAPITLDQIIVYACVFALLLGGFLLLRFTQLGLRVRALVDTPALTGLSGVNPGRLSAGIWIVSITMAGLVGVLVAPISGLNAANMALLMTSAFAAVIAGKLRSLPIAVLVGFGMGIATSVGQDLLPSASVWTHDFLQAIPFIVTIGFLLFYLLRGSTLDESQGVGGALDHAIRPQGSQSVQGAIGGDVKSLSWKPPLFGFLCLLGLPLLLHGFWIGLLAQGIAYGVIFLGFSLTTGEGGMVWLCQSAFAGAGGMTVALITHDHHVPVLISLVLGGLAAVPFGLLIGLLTIRMGDIYIALVTLAFGLLADNIVFTRQIFDNSGVGVPVYPPHFASGSRVLTYGCIAVFVIFSLLIVNLRRSTTGLSVTAVRASSRGSRTIGLSVVQMKLLLAALAAFAAGIGGAMLAIVLNVSLASNYATLAGEVWLVALVTQGIRSNTAALLAGLGSTILAGFAAVYLPPVYGNFVPVLFGLGAIGMVKFPEGVLTMQARQFREVMMSIRQSTPKLYQWVRTSSAIYFVIFIALLLSVRNLWWLWLAITAFLAHVVGGYLFRRSAKKPKVTSTAEVDQQPAFAGAVGMVDEVPVSPSRQ